MVVIIIIIIYFATEDQSARPFGDRLQSGAHDQIFISVGYLRSSGSLPDERTDL
jgi:hypothetical protein